MRVRTLCFCGGLCVLLTAAAVPLFAAAGHLPPVLSAAVGGSMSAGSGSFLPARPAPSPAPAMRPPRQLVPVSPRARRPADPLRPADPGNTGRRSSSWPPAPPYSPWDQYPQPGQYPPQR